MKHMNGLQERVTFDCSIYCGKVVRMEEKGKLESGRGVSPIPLITSLWRETALAALLFVPAGLIEQRVTDSPRGCCPISGLPAPNGWVRAPIGWGECGKECREGFTRTGSTRAIYKYRRRVAEGDSTRLARTHMTARLLSDRSWDLCSPPLWPSQEFGHV